MFVISVENSDDGETILSLVVDRSTLEQVEGGIHDALVRDPVVIRRCKP